MNSKDDAYIFCMKPWSAQDLVVSWKGIATNCLLSLVEGEETTIKNVSDAIYAHPKLGALARNARSAHYLTQPVAPLSKVNKD